MNLPRWVVKGLGRIAPARKTDASKTYFHVSNLTRNTVLGSRVELAGTAATRGKGLLGRQGLSPGQGLWIVPCESVHTIGMKFSIDLVYLDRKHCVKKIRHSVPPWRMSACLSAHSILELPSGVIRDSQTQPGDQLQLAPDSSS
jgi:uncharacterized membrane protein (UPF0127 family)